MSDGVLIWWVALCAASVLNVAGWTGSALHVGHATEGVQRRLRLRLLALAGVYVAGCAFRSILPMIDVPRLCLHDTVVSRIVVGRSIATVAELCFVAQWALVLRQAGASVGSRTAIRIARSLVPLIVIAEAASWFAVLTTDNLFHAVENSLWTGAATLAMAACVALRAAVDARGRRIVDVALACGAGYLAFMLIVDVPMYLSRWQAALASGHEPLALAQGFDEVLRRCRVVRDWAAWRADVPWLTLYFTVAVWISIALVHVPPLRPRERRHQDGGLK